MNKRTPIETKTFENTGSDFSALYAAENWLKEKGYSCGPTSIDGPVAIFKGDCIISKWRNLSPEEKNDVDGLISGNPREHRNGSVIVEFYR